MSYLNEKSGIEEDVSQETKQSEKNMSVRGSRLGALTLKGLEETQEEKEELVALRNGQRVNFDSINGLSELSELESEEIVSERVIEIESEADVMN